MPQPNSRAWKLCVALVVILSALTFTPLVIPAGQFQPELFGIPYTLWISISAHHFASTPYLHRHPGASWPQL